MRRIVVPSKVINIMSPGAITLSRRESHYARNVLRLKEGDQVELLDGRGLVARGTIRGMHEGGVEVYLQEFGQSQTLESELQIHLLMGLPRSNRWELIIQKTTELGITHLWPVYTDRCEIKIPDNKLKGRMERWQKIASEAARQCGRSRSPEIAAPTVLREALLRVQRDPFIDLQLVAWEEESTAEERTLDTILSTSGARNVAYLIGPEGGLTTTEIERCKEAEFHVVGMGPRVLRTETAAITLCALLQYRLGDIG